MKEGKGDECTRDDDNQQEGIFSYISPEKHPLRPILVRLALPIYFNLVFHSPPDETKLGTAFRVFGSGMDAFLYGRFAVDSLPEENDSLFVTDCGGPRIGVAARTDSISFPSTRFARPWTTIATPPRSLLASATTLRDVLPLVRRAKSKFGSSRSCPPLQLIRLHRLAVA